MKMRHCYRASDPLQWSRLATNNFNSKDVATAASSNSVENAEAASSAWICQLCKAGPFKGKRGLSVHMHSKHVKEHSELVEAQDQTRVKARWSEEERFVVASRQVELGLSEDTMARAEIVRKLHDEFPNRSVESLKKLLVHKSYVDKLNALRSRVCDQVETLETVREEEPAMVTQTEPEYNELESWCRANAGYFSLELPEVVTVEWVEQEYAKWAAGLPKDRKKSKSSGRKVHFSDEYLTSRQKRRQAYARIQKLYRRDRTRAAKTVLSGEWQSAPPASKAKAKAMFASWKGIMEASSAKDDRSHKVSDELVELIAPISSYEVERALKKAKASACGPDLVSLETLKKVQVEVLSAHFNLWLWCEHLPSELNKARTVFIPKVDQAGPLEHRPISICSHVTRIFHKILANRCEQAVELSIRQVGFRKLDGAGANLTLARALIDHAKTARKQISLCFVDIKKAFDSVSHESMRYALEVNKVPGGLIRYICKMYKAATSVLEFEGKQSGIVKLGRGVRQGDPLSSFLFNLTLDLSLRELPAELGFKFNSGCSVNHLAYADDTVLVSETQVGLEKLVGKFESEAKRTGLELSPGKCASLSICLTKRDRCVYYSSKPLVIRGEPLPLVDLEKGYKYLGIHVNPLKNISKARDKLGKGLAQLSRAPLKPQQRLFMLRIYLIPQIIHDLVFTRQTDRSLAELDRMIRASMRAWLKWPKDSPVGLFHAKVEDGGMGIQSLRLELPILERNRLERLFESTQDLVLRELFETEPLRSRFEKASSLRAYAGVGLRTREDALRAWKIALCNSIDGKGLSDHNGIKPHGFMASGSSLMTGGEFVSVSKIRGNLVSTKGRQSRGRPLVDPKCDCCKREYESLAHVLQVCPRTHESRVARHDNILDCVEKALKEQKAEVLVEPRIPTPEGIRKPDLVVRKEGVVYVMDCQIVADNADLQKSHLSKTLYYDKREIRDFALSRLPSEREVVFSSITLNWRGEISIESVRLMEQKLKLSSKLKAMLALKVLEGGSRIRRHFSRSTYSCRS